MQLPFARVLIVDDEPRSQIRMQIALESVGFQCDIAGDGDEALLRIAESRYHAVITELVLPKTNGGELVFQLCAEVDAPLIVVHTRPLEQEVYVGLKNEGVDAIFYKPSDYNAMARSIRSLVEGRATPRTAQDRWKKWCHESARSTSVLQTLRHGDGWIQDSTIRVEAFRFMIIILACILFGMGWGNSLDPTMAGICRMFGLCGFAFYFCLELVAYYRDQNRSRVLRWSVERRLTEQKEAADGQQARRDSNHSMAVVDVC